MKNEDHINRLTEKEFETLIKLSEDKVKKVREKTKEMYRELTKDMTRKDREFLRRFDRYFKNLLDRKLERARRKKAWEEGWKKKDPYNLLNYLILFPIVKKRWLDKDITTHDVQEDYDKYGVNEMIREELGEDEVKEFIKIWNNQGYEYYKKLANNGLYEKLYYSNEIRAPKWKGIPKPIPRQILGKMRKFRKKFQMKNQKRFISGMEKEGVPTKDQIGKFKEEFGLSRSTYFRRKKKLKEKKAPKKATSSKKEIPSISWSSLSKQEKKELSF